ncbi:MAG: HAD family hydrolase [Dorea sp.]|nr:HAD family hydrolase [Dorea sp.]
MEKRKIICFDVDDTLYERSQPFVRACKELLAPKFELDWHALFKKRNYYADVCFEDEASGRISKEEMYLFRISQALADFGKEISDGEILKFEERYAYFQHHISITPGMDQLLDLLVEKEIPVGIVTNGPSARQRVKINALDLGKWIPEKCWCVSGDYQTCKPHKEMFEISAAKLQEAYGNQELDFWYVGDNYSNDVIGPKNAGWKVIWYCTTEEAKKKHAADEIQPDYICSNAQEIIQILESE